MVGIGQDDENAAGIHSSCGRPIGERVRHNVKPLASQFSAPGDLFALLLVGGLLTRSWAAVFLLRRTCFSTSNRS